MAADHVTLLATLTMERSVDVSRVRRAVSRQAAAMGFGALDRTRLVTATSELARNMLTHGGGGVAQLERVEAGDGTTALRVCFEDTGPGIGDLEQALADGFSTGPSLGLGLGGARRLVDEFTIESQLGSGTRVMIASWLRPARRAGRQAGT